jgi:hypothetical protein
LIRKLSQKQVSQFPEFISKWSAIGLSTEPLDHTLVERRIGRAYQYAGRPEPETYRWFNSPIQAAVAYLALMLLEKTGEPGSAIFGKSLNLSVGPVDAADLEKIKASVSEEVFSMLTMEMADVVNDRVFNLVEAKIMEAVLDGLHSAIASNQWVNVGTVLPWTAVDGGLEKIRRIILADLPGLSTLVFRQGLGREATIDRICLCDYLSNVCNVTNFASPEIILVGESLTWWWPFEEICLISERYSDLHLDDNFMLHNSSGAAVRYPGDWGIYSYHGILVPAWLITEPERITPQIVLQQQDPMLRGVMLELYAESRFSKDTGIDVLPLGQYQEWASNISPMSNQVIAIFRGKGLHSSAYVVRRP